MGTVIEISKSTTKNATFVDDYLNSTVTGIVSNPSFTDEWNSTLINDNSTETSNSTDSEIYSNSTTVTDDGLNSTEIGYITDNTTNTAKSNESESASPTSSNSASPSKKPHHKKKQILPSAMEPSLPLETKLTSSPTANPTFEPTFDPTANPTANPTSKRTIRGTIKKQDQTETDDKGHAFFVFVVVVAVGIFTLYQMKTKPDGFCAAITRLIIAIVVFLFSCVTWPARALLCPETRNRRNYRGNASPMAGNTFSSSRDEGGMRPMDLELS